jgi:dual specificity tyrosine-phosphorylation-regulated kinase 2/3/4
MLEIFDLLSQIEIIHADIKPDNILVQFDESTQTLTSIKLIDFGSAFSFRNPTQISMSTPEYLSPEVLDHLDDHGSSCVDLISNMKSWSYDMWSLGAIILEILTGIPIWMSLKCRMVT